MLTGGDCNQPAHMNSNRVTIYVMTITAIGLVGLSQLLLFGLSLPKGAFHLIRKIQAFDHEECGFEVRLGTPMLRPSPVVDAVIRHGAGALPYLLQALNSRKPKRAGYAAFCLIKLGHAEAAAQVSAALGHFNSQPKDDENSFARCAMIEYLRRYGDTPKNSRHRSW